MSQPPVLNGPSSINVPFKDVQAAQETTKPSNGSPIPPAPYQAAPRPPLARLDSRATLPIRPGFPPNQGVVLRPQIRAQGQPQLIGQPQQQIGQPPQHIGQPPAQQIFQRPPGIVQRPPIQGQAQVPGQPQFRPVNPNFRPPTPFPRPPPVRPPGIFQQRSVPAYAPRPPFESDKLPRSQTLDTTDGMVRIPEDVKFPNDPPRTNIMMQNRSFSLSSNPDKLDDERRRSVSSIGSLDEKRSLPGSMENLDKKSEGDYPSRPESRSSVRMNRIMEDDASDKLNHKSPSPVIEQKSVEFVLPQKIETKPPLPPREDVKVPQIVEKHDPKSLELKNLSKPAKSPSRSEGDNDSGVDESTQGNDQSSNGDTSSPRKSSGKLSNRTSSTTPTKNRSLSRGSKSPSLKSPDSTASTPGTTEKKKVPMNKIQVGSAPSPNLKVVRSKIGSLENASYKPGGGKVKIENKKVEFKAAPRIDAINDKYVPKGGDKKIQQQKLQWNAKSKIGSLENTTHKPKGGDKKIESIKLDFKGKAKPKVGSKDNMKHVPGGGDIKFDDDDEEIEIKPEIENRKLDLKVQSKIGSLDNMKHKPGGGDKKIFDDKEYLKQRSELSSQNQSLSGSQIRNSRSSMLLRAETARDLQPVQEAIPTRPSSSLSRSNSLRRSKKKKACTPRAPWRF